MSVANNLNSFSTELQELPRKMRRFSLCLRSLYADHAVDSSASKATGINKIRDQTRQDAIVYVRGVMPLTTKVVRFIQEFFEYYEALELEEWKTFLPDILEDVTGYQQCCTEIVRMHEEMMITLKKREDEAKVLLSELQDLNKEVKQRKAEKEQISVISELLAYVLSFNSNVDPNVARILNMNAESVSAQARADGQKVNINNATIKVVSEAMVPALSNFLDGLNMVAGFFNTMKEELISFHSKGEQGKKLHYVMMSKKAVEVKKGCKNFYAMIPGIRTDLQCIPQKSGDQNYVDIWLKRQHQQIRGKYSGKLKGQLQKMLKECESTERVQQLVTKK